MRGTVLILVLFFGVAGSLGAQAQQGSWDNPNRLQAGQGIEVIEFNLKPTPENLSLSPMNSLTRGENASDVSLRSSFSC